MKRLLIQFAKLPTPGQVKTRLIPALGAEGACQLHRQLMTHTLFCLKSFKGVDHCLWLAGDSEHAELPYWQGQSPIVWQQGVDLGERMANALQQGLTEYDQVVLVGSDCPALDKITLEQAFEVLESHDMVYCPAEDGGYVLVGASTLVSEAFKGIEWGTSKVMQQSLQSLAQTSATWQLLKPLWDLDRPEDLIRLEALEGGLNCLEVPDVDVAQTVIG